MRPSEHSVEVFEARVEFIVFKGKETNRDVDIFCADLGCNF